MLCSTLLVKAGCFLPEGGHVTGAWRIKQKLHRDRKDPISKRRRHRFQTARFLSVQTKQKNSTLDFEKATDPVLAWICLCSWWQPGVSTANRSVVVWMWPQVPQGTGSNPQLGCSQVQTALRSGLKSLERQSPKWPQLKKIRMPH